MCFYFCLNKNSGYLFVDCRTDGYYFCKTKKTKMSDHSNLETATFANGCFWCTEAVFQELKGVEKVTSGYTGGHVANPTYEQVCNKDTGHAECLQIEYDPQQISFDELLEVFWKTHDSDNRDFS